MHINDQSTALKGYLRKHYEAQIQSLLDDARQEYQRRINGFVQRGKQDAQTLLEQARRQAHSQQQVALSSLQVELQQRLTEVREELFGTMFKLVEERFSSLAPTKKELLVKNMLVQVQETIKLSNFSPSQFTLHVWKDVSAQGVTSDLDELGVRAVSADVIFEDSVTQRLHKIRDLLQKKSIAALDLTDVEGSQ